MVKVWHVVDQGKLNTMLKSPSGAIAKDMMRRGQKVVNAAKRNISSDPTRVNTGRLRSSVTMQLVMGGSRIAVRVGTNVKYARYVHDGTGLYGPRHAMIRPVSKKALRWKGGGKGGYVFSKTSRGMRPNPFLKKALQAARG